ncbi:hypothetical protein [Fulvivirga lutea]|uniref:Uncharacterized protein n=1 Tax=Fulvivirga lutea TaxID=2810512 RepID=A0A974WJM1_9BACT|nr:hypothetical protein [Fulvivirga lutea]QSE98993.1 hypothetical protein JR347_07880 [Fulvivirga lutea]
MNYELIIYSTILLILGIWFDRLGMRDFYVIFAYLPTWGLMFLLATKKYVKSSTKYVLIGTLLYILLHYVALFIRPVEIIAIVTSSGAVLILILFKKLKESVELNNSDFLIVFVLGGLAFTPWIIANNMTNASISVFFWHLTVGHYLTYLTKRQTSANIP